VVRDFATTNDEPQPVFYQPFSQKYVPQMTLVARTAHDAVPVDAVRRAIQSASADLVAQGLRTLDEQLAALYVPARSATRIDPASTLRGE
jgi:hypothetical protein